jgi:hypothetical protein
MEQQTTDKFRCVNPVCGCEVLISRSGGDGGIDPPRPPVCSCGQPMKPGWARPVWIPSLRRGQRLGTYRRD